MISIGVDVGNSDTKTQHCSLVSGYRKYEVKPEIAYEILNYNGAYYVPDISERMPYVVDKTKDERCLILTLFGIAKEMIYIARERNSERVQQEIDEMRHIKLGVGLPPGHFNSFSKPLAAYYSENLTKKEVSFTFKGFSFKFYVDSIKVFPQDFVAVYKNKNSEVAKKKRYYIVGIGGGTVDVTPVIDGLPDTNACFSLSLGTRVMYRQTIADVQRQYGQTLDESLVEDILRKEETVLPEEITKLVIDDANNHFYNIINGCIQQGVKLDLYPVVFFGGGCLLLKDQILSNDLLKNPEIIEDINANAKAYAQCI